MAVSTANVSPDPGLGSVGAYRVGVRDVTFDNSYVTGGEPIAASAFGLTRIRFGFADIKTTGGAHNTVSVVVVPQTDGSALLKANTAAAQVANAVDLSTLVATVVAFGDG